MKLYSSGNSKYLIVPKRIREKYDLDPEVEYMCFVDKDRNVIYKPIETPIVDEQTFEQPVLSTRAQEIMKLFVNTNEIYKPSLMSKLHMTYAKGKSQAMLQSAINQLKKLGLIKEEGMYLIRVAEAN